MGVYVSIYPIGKERFLESVFIMDEYVNTSPIRKEGVLGSLFCSGAPYILSLHHIMEKKYDLWRVYSNQYWLITSGVLWHSSDDNLTRNAPILDISLVTTKFSHSQVSRTLHTTYYSGSKVTMYIDICFCTQQAIQKDVMLHAYILCLSNYLSPSNHLTF